MSAHLLAGRQIDNWKWPLRPLWEQVRIQLRRRISILDFELWANPAQPLRVLTGPHVMFDEIPAYYMQQRRAKGVPTIVDYALLQTWADAGIFPVAVTRGIAAVFESQGVGDLRQINSLKYFAQPILREARDMKEAAVGRYEDIKARPPEWTLLLGLPRSGRAIYKALGARDRLHSAAQAISPALRVALTVYPDDWQKKQVPPDFLEDGK